MEMDEEKLVGNEPVWETQLNDQIIVKDLARLRDSIEFERLIPVPYGVNYPAKEITTKYLMRNCCYAMLI